LDYVHGGITPWTATYRLDASAGDRLFVDSWARLGSAAITPIRVVRPSAGETPEIRIGGAAQVWRDEEPVIRSQSSGLVLNIAGSVTHDAEGEYTNAAIFLGNSDEAGNAVNATVTVTGTSPPRAGSGRRCG